MVMIDFAIRLTLFALLSLCSNFCLANVPWDFYYGRGKDFTNARSLGLGGVSGSIVAPSGIFVNPAVIGFIKKPSIEFSDNLSLVAERRTKQVFDRFENSLGAISIAENFFVSNKIGPFAFVYPLGVSAIGFGFTPVTDYYYHYRQIIRDDFYQKIGELKIEMDGSVYYGNLISGFRIKETFGFGAGVYFSFGKRRLSSMANTPDTFQKMLGLGFLFGTSIKIGKQFSIGGDWTSPPIVKKGLLESRPMSVGISGSYTVPGQIPATLFFESRFVGWTSSSRQNWSIRSGVEHTMLNNTNLRYGFGLITTHNRYQPLVSLGLGFKAGPLAIDIGANLKWNVLESNDFIEPLNGDIKTELTISDVGISISY